MRFPFSLFVSLHMLGVLVLTASCAAIGGSDPEWKSICCYNHSLTPICVTSLQGIQAYAKKRGPQDLGFGNMKPGAVVSRETTFTVRLVRPIKIVWMDRILRSSTLQWPKSGDTVNQHVVQSFDGLSTDTDRITQAGSLVFVFTGTEWKTFFIEGRSGLSEAEIRQLL